MSPFRIIRAVGRKSLPRDLRLFAAPPDWPIPICCNDGSLVEPVYNFVRTKYRSHKRSEYFNTQRAVTQDLKDWWDFLAYYNLGWSNICQVDLFNYRDAMLGTISPHTKLPYAYSTIIRRVGSVIRFYDWSNKRSLTKIQLPSRLTEQQIAGNADERFATRYNKIRSKDIIAGAGSSRDDNVEYISLPKIALLRKELGPLPSEIQSSTRGECRDRLTFELMLNCGLRISEVTGLYGSDFMELDISSTHANDRIPVSITRKTKGGKSRRVLISVSLISEVRRYIETERRQILMTLPAENAATILEDPPELFLNSKRSVAYKGRPLQTGRIRSIFIGACIRAGLVKSKQIRKSVSDTGESIEFARYTPHHLRHTFAINEYHAQRRAGNSEPWKIIQVLLGHSTLATTQETYLRVCTLTENEISQASLEYLFSTIDRSHDSK